MSDLQQLLARVEGATGADRRLDGALCRAFDLPACFEPDCLPDVLERCVARVEGGGKDDTDVPRYTASMDAALALVERVKGSGIDAVQMMHDAMEDLANGGWRDDAPIAPQVALCVIARLLRALLAEAASAAATPFPPQPEGKDNQ